MANIKHVDSVVDRDFRNRINQLIDVVNSIGTSLNDLVVKGVMTTEQYSQLLTAINGLVKIGEINVDTLSAELRREIEQINNKVDKGNVSVSDINKNLGKIDQTFLSDELLQQIAGTAPINAVPADNSITLKKLAFKQLGTNLYNKNTTKNDVFYWWGSGKENASEGSRGSDFIPITPNTQYIIRAVRQIAFFKEDKTYLSGVNDTRAKLNYVLTTPSNAYFMRISWMATDLGASPQQVNKGNVLLPYEDYKEFIPKEYIEKYFDIDTVGKHSLPIEKMSFSEIGNNLFNKNAIEVESTLSTTTGATNVASGFVSSGFIEIMPQMDYFIRHARAVVFYGEDKGFISGQSIPYPYNDVKVKSPNKARFVRFSWYVPNYSINNQMINKGVDPLPFEEYGYRIKREVLSFENKSKAKLILPPKINAVVGKEINIYFENISNIPLNGYQIDVTCSIGKHYEDRWTANPTNTGTHSITISLYKDFEMIETVSSSIIVKSQSVGSGVTKNAVIIGDSTIAQDWVVNRLEDIFETDSLTVNLLGTLGTYGKKHNEGRSGWTMADYRTNKTYNGVANPFFNPSTSDFDFNYYMTQQNFVSMDYVVLCLGINDTFSFTNDKDLKDAIPTILGHFDFVINNILSVNPVIKVGVCVTIPPNQSQNAFGEAYFNEQTQWRYKRNNAIWIEELVGHYRDRNDVFLIPDNSNINAKTGFRDGIHPNQEIGDMQRADTFYYWFKSFES